jgi:formate hydrogenlyase subunit 4
MIHENEVIMLALGIAVFFFALVNRTHLERIPGWNLLLAAYCILLAGWVMTVLEGFFPAGALNLVEHLCYAGSTLMLAAWCRRFVQAGGRPGP